MRSAQSAVSKTFQSTLPVWGATTCLQESLRLAVISIHAPRVGSDHDASASFGALKISIHAPRVGSDLYMQTHRGATRTFQSTLPVWGATVAS